MSTNGNDAGSGRSWDDALASVQAGIDRAAERVAAGREACEVWVSEGEYFPTRDSAGSDAPEDPRTRTFLLKDKVALHGGFAGIETERREDRTLTVTILSGDIGLLDDVSDNAYHVVTAANGATISDFQITQGNANGADDAQRLGGGIFIGDTSPTIIGCYVGANNAERGGGTYISSGSPTITGGGFDANSATDIGGGVYLEDGAPVFADSSASANEAANLGGGVYMASGSLSFTGGSIASDHAKDGGGLYVAGGTVTLTGVSLGGHSMTERGGAMFVSGASATLTDCQLGGNQATDSGGAIFASGATLTIDGCDFSGNSAQLGAGGGIDNEASMLTVTRSSFQGCSAPAAEQGGGAVRNRDGATATFENCLFAGNVSNFGGALYDLDSSSVVVNSLFIGNTAMNSGGAAIYEQGGASIITNCIFWQNLGSIAAASIDSTDGSTPTVTYSDVEGGCTVASGCTTDETGNIDADPLFVEGDYDYSLPADSPCVDTASESAAPETDTAGNPRVDVPGVGNDGADFADMGPREYQP